MTWHRLKGSFQGEQDGLGTAWNARSSEYKTALKQLASLPFGWKRSTGLSHVED
jgi:hypothetical protein